MFGTWDWFIVGAYIAGTTAVGHALKGRQHSTRDFFLGGRRLPWYAVTASTIATTISAITFIGVPALVFAAGGNYAEARKQGTTRLEGKQYEVQDGDIINFRFNV